MRGTAFEKAEAVCRDHPISGEVTNSRKKPFAQRHGIGTPREYLRCALECALRVITGASLNASILRKDTEFDGIGLVDQGGHPGAFPYGDVRVEPTAIVEDGAQVDIIKDQELVLRSPFMTSFTETVFDVFRGAIVPAEDRVRL